MGAGELPQQGRHPAGGSGPASAAPTTRPACLPGALGHLLVGPQTGAGRAAAGTAAARSAQPRQLQHDGGSAAAGLLRSISSVHRPVAWQRGEVDWCVGMWPVRRALVCSTASLVAASSFSAAVCGWSEASRAACAARPLCCCSGAACWLPAWTFESGSAASVTTCRPLICAGRVPSSRGHAHGEAPPVARAHCSLRLKAELRGWPAQECTMGAAAMRTSLPPYAVCPRPPAPLQTAAGRALRAQVGGPGACAWRGASPSLGLQRSGVSAGRSPGCAPGCAAPALKGFRVTCTDASPPRARHMLTCRRGRRRLPLS